MSRKRLTQAAVDKVTPPPTGRLEIFDTDLPGFGLRVSAPRKAAPAHKSWFVLFRMGGKLTRYTIGTTKTYEKVDEARARARQILQDARAGISPAAAVPEPPARPVDTVQSVATQFIERYAKPKNRGWRDVEMTLDRHVISRWGGRAAASITRRDVLELLDEMVDAGTPIAANRVLAAVRKMFGWAVERDILPASPVTNITAPGKETERERVLTDDELVKIWAAAEQIGAIAGAFFRLLVLTAQRRDEVAGMRWSDLDLGAKVWTLSRDQTKGDRSHEVPLSAPAVEILTALPRLGEYVLSSTRGDRPISGYSKMKARVDQLTEIQNWRIHDLRRSAGTGMARAGIAVSTISRVLNHKEGGVTKIYNRYSYLDEKRHALETWGRKVETLVRPGADNVVTLRA